MICIKCKEKEAENKSKNCNSCNYLQKKKSNPIRIAYQSLKGHAKERGKDFNLTIQEFTEFCIKSEYINKKGIKKDSFHIDRINESVGYQIGNLQLLTNSENIRKYIQFVEINRDGSKKFTTTVNLNLNNQINDTPF